MLCTAFINWKNPQTHRKNAILLFGFDPEKPVFDLLEVNQNLNKIKMQNVLFDRSSRGDYKDAIAQIAQGQTVSTKIENRTIHLQGLFSVGDSFAGDGNLIARDQNFLRIVTKRKVGELSIGLITLKLNADLNTIATDLQGFPRKPIPRLCGDELVEPLGSVILSNGNKPR